MDHLSVSRLVVEEKFGWTIVSSLMDEDREDQKKTDLKNEADDLVARAPESSSLQKELDQDYQTTHTGVKQKPEGEDKIPNRGDEIPKGEDEMPKHEADSKNPELYREYQDQGRVEKQENIDYKVPESCDEKEDSESEEKNNDDHDNEKEDPDSEEKNDADDGGGGGYGYLHQNQVLQFVEPQRGFPWDSHREDEANLSIIRQQHQPDNKPGLMWRASLVATLGFFGWVVLSGIAGNGKNLRSLKLHPCSVKGGEPVLNTL